MPSLPRHPWNLSPAEAIALQYDLATGVETIGAVPLTEPGVKPLYITDSHRVSLETAIEPTMAGLTRYRLPETTRAVHRLASGR